MADIDSLMEMPWAKRAMDSNTPTLNIDEQEATVRTMSSNYNGKEILFPTIRMVDGELKRFDEKTAKEIAIEKNDYVEYDTPDQATKASKALSNFIGFARDPKGTMEREEKEYQDHMENLPFGNVQDFFSGITDYPLKPDEDKGIMYRPVKSKMEIVGGGVGNELRKAKKIVKSDLETKIAGQEKRNEYIQKQLTSLKSSVSFMALYNYFNPPKKGE